MTANDSQDSGEQFHEVTFDPTSRPKVMGVRFEGLNSEFLK